MSILEKVCQTEESLKVVVRMRPSLDHLGNMGAILLTRCVSFFFSCGDVRETDGVVGGK